MALVSPLSRIAVSNYDSQSYEERDYYLRRAVRRLIDRLGTEAVVRELLETDCLDAVNREWFVATARAVGDKTASVGNIPRGGR